MQRAVLRAAYGVLFSAIAACAGTVQDGTETGKSAADADAATSGVDGSLTPDGGGGAESSGSAGGTAGQSSGDSSTECIPAYQAYQGCFTTEECCPATSSGEIVCYVPPGLPPPPDGGHPYFPPGRCTEAPVRPDGGSCTPASYECLANADCCSGICMDTDGRTPASDGGWSGGGWCQPAGCTAIGLPCETSSDCCRAGLGNVVCNGGVCLSIFGH